MSSRVQVGLDIGGRNIKMVALISKGSQFELKAHAFFHAENMAQAVQAFKHPLLKNADIHCNVEDDSLKIRRVMVPAADLKEAETMVPWSLKDIPQERQGEYLFRFQEVACESDEGQKGYLVAALRKKVIQERLNQLEAWGVPQIKSLQPSVGAAAMSLVQTQLKGLTSPLALIDFGHKQSSFAVFDQYGLLYLRRLKGLSGDSLTRRLSRDLGITLEEAEAIKTEGVPEGLEADFKSRFENSRSHFVSNAMVEIQRSIDNSIMETGIAEISQLRLMGGASLLSGFLEKMQETLNLNCTYYDPFVEIQKAQFESDPKFQSKRHFYSVACGLAMFE